MLKQSGFAHILIIVAILGVIAFLVISSSAEFKDKLFSTLFPKPASHASGNAIRGQAGDLWADTVIGQRDFGEVSANEIFPNDVASPGGVVVDRSVSPGRMYVWDSKNSRILGVNLANCYNLPADQNCSADIVIGQPSGSDYGGCNHDSSHQNYPGRVLAGADTLCGMEEDVLTVLEHKTFAQMYVDSQGNLYVPDIGNNRVLKYNSPFTTDTIADEVWGQSDFTGNQCNRIGGIRGENPNNAGNNTLCLILGGGVALDPTGNLWVADTLNNRVLRFPVGSKTADLVLGQSDLSGKGIGILKYPNSLGFGPGGELYIGEAEGGDEPVDVFEEPFTTNMPVSRTFGSGFKGTFIGEVILPSQSTNPGLWIQNYRSWNVELWGFDGIKKKSINLGHGIGGGVGVDAQDGLIFPAYNSGSVFYFSATNNYAGIGSAGETYPTANKRLFDDGFNQITARRLIHAAWVGMGVTADQLIIADEHRLQFWNDLSNLTNGQAPSGKVNIPGQTIYGAVPTTQLKTDSSERIWVITDRKRVDVYQGPLTETSTPFKQITFPLQTIDGSTISYIDAFDGIVGLAVSDDAKYLWITQQDRNRVLRIIDPLTTSPRVDIVLGQPSLTEIRCNSGLMGVSKDAPLNTLCLSGAIALDKLGNLYISDNFIETAGNGRMLMFSKSLFPDNPPAMIFALSATKKFPFEAWEPAFDSANRMVVGFNPYSGLRFPAYFNDPTDGSTQPSGYLKDYYSWAIASAFDSQDNLYVYDANRGQVRIYKTPFVVSSPPSPSPSSIPNPQPTPKPGDMNGDDAVNVLDFGVLLANWNTPNSIADLNGDGTVNVLDFGILLSNWGT